MIDRAHALGLRIYGGTLYPVEGYPFPGFWTPDLEAKRQAVNHWIRTSKAYDAVIDFDKVLRDPSHPTRLLPAYDSGDHVASQRCRLQGHGRCDRPVAVPRRRRGLIAVEVTCTRCPWSARAIGWRLEVASTGSLDIRATHRNRSFVAAAGNNGASGSSPFNEPLVASETFCTISSENCVL